MRIFNFQFGGYIVIVRGLKLMSLRLLSNLSSLWVGLADSERETRDLLLAHAIEQGWYWFPSIAFTNLGRHQHVFLSLSLCVFLSVCLSEPFLLNEPLFWCLSKPHKL